MRALSPPPDRALRIDCYHRAVSEQSWRLSVRDAHGRTHRGVVVYVDRASALPALGPADEFRIILLSRSHRTAVPSDASVLCVPAAGSSLEAALAPAARLSSVQLSEKQMVAYRDGSIISAMPLAVSPADVFPAAKRRPEFKRLALAIADALESERVAAYLGTLRHALGVRPGGDALGALASRLAPDARSERPPRRAPGIARLHRALADLGRRTAPEASLEQFAEDLRLLRVFGRDDAWPREAMQRLLSDVQPRRSTGRRNARRASCRWSGGVRDEFRATHARAVAGRARDRGRRGARAAPHPAGVRAWQPRR